MKRALFETVAVLPLVSGSVVQRTGYESAVLALTVAQNATATVKVEHCDTQDGTFEAVGDSRLFVDNPVNESGEAIVKNEGRRQPLPTWTSTWWAARSSSRSPLPAARPALWRSAMLSTIPCTRSPPSPRQAAVPAVKGAAAMARMFTPPRRPAPARTRSRTHPASRKSRTAMRSPRKAPRRPQGPGR